MSKKKTECQSVAVPRRDGEKREISRRKLRSSEEWPRRGGIIISGYIASLYVGAAKAIVKTLDLDIRR